MYGKRICLKIKEKKFDGDNVDLKKGQVKGVIELP